ncbi:MAG: YdcF family protein [Eubacteriales bacterium]|nr:YdcF family protein [Eubacteriales bacterium]
MEKKIFMNVIWLVLALICLGYYIKCASYAGIGSSFIFIWLIGTVFFGLIFTVKLLELKGIIHVANLFRICFIVIMAAGISLFVFVEAIIIKGMTAKPRNNCDYIIVLGCQIRGDHITRSLKNRLNVAVDYAADNPDTTIIVSGGKGKGENTTEAYAMYNYLVSKGIDGSRIIQEDKSTDTSENMKYSVKYIDNKDAMVGIVTNNFHIARSRLLARHAGLKNTCGMPAESDHVLFINYMVREAIGIVKDFVFGNF